VAIPPPARAARGPARLSSGDPLREGFFRLYARSFERSEKIKPGSGRAVYRAAARAALELCGQPWAQGTIFPEETKLAREFLRETGIADGAEDAFVQQALLLNAWAPAWMGLLLKFSRDEFKAYCLVQGLEHLRVAQQEKRGIIFAHAHTLFTQVFWRWLEHVKIPPGITLWQWTWNRPRKDKEDPKLRAIEGGREMYAAARLLREGGVVHSLVDGRWGGDRVAVEFFNRKRIFQPSFAELSLMTGAAVLPVDVIVRTDGRIRIDIGERLAPPAPDVARDKRAEHLVHEYVRHLAGRWRRYAANLEWFQVRRHLSSPRWDGA
jgi:hypothetical protein